MSFFLAYATIIRYVWIIVQKISWTGSLQDFDVQEVPEEVYSISCLKTTCERFFFFERPGFEAMVRNWRNCMNRRIIFVAYLVLSADRTHQLWIADRVHLFSASHVSYVWMGRGDRSERTLDDGWWWFDGRMVDHARVKYIPDEKFKRPAFWQEHHRVKWIDLIGSSKWPSTCSM